MSCWARPAVAAATVLMALLAGLVSATPAKARIFVGFGFPAYFGPPVYYVPPPVYYAPRVAYPPPTVYRRRAPLVRHRPVIRYPGCSCVPCCR